MLRYRVKHPTSPTTLSRDAKEGIYHLVMSRYPESFVWWRRYCIGSCLSAVGLNGIINKTPCVWSVGIEHSSFPAFIIVAG